MKTLQTLNTFLCKHAVGLSLAFSTVAVLLARKTNFPTQFTLDGIVG